MSAKGLIGALVVIATLGLTAKGGDNPEYGDRDDAVAMVESAVAVYEAEGLDALLAAVGDGSDLRFHDRDMYPWVVSFDGTMMAHGANQALNGKNVIAMTDSHGVEVFAEPVRIVRAKGRGWYDYTWWDPRSNAIRPKTAYVAAIGESALVGVGVFTEPVQP